MDAAIKIKEILECINIKRIHKTMKFLNWKWAHDGDSTTYSMVPSETHIRHVATSLLLDAYERSLKNNNDGVTLGTGGFEAYCNIKEDVMSLKFILTEWIAADY